MSAAADSPERQTSACTHDDDAPASRETAGASEAHYRQLVGRAAGLPPMTRRYVPVPSGAAPIPDARRPAPRRGILGGWGALREAGGRHP
jgi:hypothetical protein